MNKENVFNDLKGSYESDNEIKYKKECLMAWSDMGTMVIPSN